MPLPAALRALTLLPLMVLAACAGSPPPVASTPRLGTDTPCAGNNTPPPGYSGPISPNPGQCAPTWSVAPKPAGTFDYSTGMPPRAVRGQ